MRFQHICGFPVLITEHLHEVITHFMCDIICLLREVRVQLHTNLNTDKMELNSFFSYTVKKKFIVVYPYAGQ